MFKNKLKSISISQLQFNLAKTLKITTTNKEPVVVTNWHSPTHLIIPLDILTDEMKILILPQLLELKSESAMEQLI